MTAPISIMLCLPYEVPSQNQRDKTHWAVRGRQQHALEWMVMAEMRKANAPKAHSHRAVTILAYRKRLITDKANLIGGCKALVDALVTVGLLVDDSDKHALIDYQQELASGAPGKKPQTVVDIWEGVAS